MYIFQLIKNYEHWKIEHIIFLGIVQPVSSIHAPSHVLNMDLGVTTSIRGEEEVTSNYDSSEEDNNIIFRKGSPLVRYESIFINYLFTIFWHLISCFSIDLETMKKKSFLHREDREKTMVPTQKQQMFARSQVSSLWDTPAPRKPIPRPT